MTQIFNELDADYLVMFDADVVLKNKNVIHSLISSMLEEDLSLASGDPVMQKSDNYFQNIMRVSDFLQHYVKKNHSDGSGVYTCHGRIIAYKKDFINNIKVPKNVVGNDAFMYFSCLDKKLNYGYVEAAKVAYTMPSKLKDYLKQKSRFNKSTEIHEERFTNVDVAALYHIPRSLTIKALLSAMVSCGPIKTISYIAVKSLPYKDAGSNKGAWSVAESTK